MQWDGMGWDTWYSVRIRRAQCQTWYEGIVGDVSEAYYFSEISSATCLRWA